MTDTPPKSMRAHPKESSAGAADARPLTVTQVAVMVRRHLEDGIGAVWMEGEVSNWKQHATSGHCYFSLKDDTSQLSAVMWRSAASRLSFEPQNGLKVEVRGTMTFYEPRGQAQVVVEMMREAGVGRLWKQFLELKTRLEKEGLFDAARKRKLPALPSRVGIVTSPSGAAIRDILNVLGRRFSGVDVLIWPARVQGEGAAQEIALGIRRMGELNLCDVLIVGRGGGSMEDLWAFNEEVVARAVAMCKVPVISAVGHETDFTICDFAADVRAPTPSAAAELVVSEKSALIEHLTKGQTRLGRAMQQRVAVARARVSELSRSYALEEPRSRLRQAMMRRDDLADRLERCLALRLSGIEDARRRIGEMRGRMRLALERPLELAEQRRRELDGRLGRALAARAARTENQAARFRELESRSHRALARWTDLLGERRRLLVLLQARLERPLGESLRTGQERLRALRSRLDSLDPKSVLGRGYSIVRRARDGRILQKAEEVRPNEQILAELAKGRLRAVVVRDEDDLFA